MGLRNRTLLVNEQCFFVTATCNKWLRLIDSPGAADIVINSLNFLTGKYTCHILTFVIMPNHIHLIIYFPQNNRLSDFMRDFKKFTSVHLRKLIEDSGNMQLLEMLRYKEKEQKFKVWMDRFDDLCIISKNVFHTKIEYIHNNPLQPHWQLADLPERFPYSSAAFYHGDYKGALRLTNYADVIW